MVEHFERSPIFALKTKSTFLGTRQDFAEAAGVQKTLEAP
jgi:hypothetical protein